MKTMGQAGIDTRPLFRCVHQMPMYDRGEVFPIAEDLSARGLSLPSYPQLADYQIDRVLTALHGALKEQGFA